MKTNDLNKYFNDEGNLNKNIIIDDLNNYDAKLLGILLKDKNVIRDYAKEINGQLIFNFESLKKTLQYKSFWKDSYTKFINKIGLSSNGQFINDNSNVVLNFPFKDTVLKGSMTKESESKSSSNEPFLNDIIARPEIDEMFEPKLFVNTKKYDRNGEHNSSDFSDKDNLIIKGNNLIALHSLEKNYAGKVKLIYIDVPYYFNKNKGNDSFKYNSNFKLSTWLVFMKNRLEIAKKFLTNNGSIWIHVGEDGMHYLKVLSDSIFGSEHFVGTVPRKTRDGKSDVPFNFSQDFDWMLVYSIGDESTKPIGRQVKRNYYETPDFPGRKWRIADLTKQTTTAQRPNSDFTMINPKTGKQYPVNPNRSWAVSKSTFKKYYDKGYIGFPDDYSFLHGNKPFSRKFKDEDDLKSKSSVSSNVLLSEFTKAIMGKAEKVSKNEWVDKSKFPYAKPEKLMKDIIGITTNENDIVLDFFMGSATTQSVAMKMNRRFIGIEQMDYINNVSVPRLQKVIDGEQGGISKDVNWQGGGSFIYVELMDKNNQYINKINGIKNIDELNKVYSDMQRNADFDINVDLSEFDKERNKYNLEEQQKALIQMIDKNQLYYNYHNIDDYNVKELLSNNDYNFNKSFYS